MRARAEAGALVANVVRLTGVETEVRGDRGVAKRLQALPQAAAFLPAIPSRFRGAFG